jgi:MarR family transcriptional regulator, organic hydroperoxide resistance regulator
MSEKESGQATGDDPASWPTGRLLSTASRLVEHAWVDALERVGLTHAGLIALHLLQGGPLSQTELARRAHVENQTMSRTLERLQREGFIERQPDAADRRRHVVSVTPAGHAAWQSSWTLERDIMPPIGDVDAFRSALLSIIESSAAKRWEP